MLSSRAEFLRESCRSGRAMDRERCPYCIEGQQYRMMTPIERYLICALCGHMVIPDASHVCSCARCQKLASPANHSEQPSL